MGRIGEFHPTFVIVLFLSVSSILFAQTTPELSEKFQKQLKKIQESSPPDFEATERKVLPSVVRIKTGESIGTGFAVADGHVIVTNSHVVDGASTVEVELTNGNKLSGSVLVNMPHRDLAAVHVDARLEPLALATEDQFTWKSPVFVVGHGLGLKNLQNSGELTYLHEWGDSKVRSRSFPLANDTLILETDATVHPGHSGSALLTPDGLVVGVIFSIRLGKAETNFAIHVVHVKELIEDALRQTVTTSDLINANILAPPMPLTMEYADQIFAATLTRDGTVEFNDKTFTTPTQAAAAAQATVVKNAVGADGWILWRIQDPDGGRQPLDKMRLTYTKSQFEPGDMSREEKRRVRKLQSLLRRIAKHEKIANARAALRAKQAERRKRGGKTRPGQNPALTSMRRFYGI